MPKKIIIIPGFKRSREVEPIIRKINISVETDSELI